MQGGKCDAGDLVLFWADLGLGVLRCVRCFVVLGFFRHCFFCSRNQFLIISNIFSLQLLVFYITCIFQQRPAEFSGAKVVTSMLLLPEHTKISFSRAYISWNSFSTMQEEFNLAKFPTEDLPVSFIMPVLQRVFLDLSGEKLCGGWKLCPGCIVSRHLPGDGV